VVRWTWIVDRGRAIDLGPKERAGTGYDREELREATTSSIWSEYLVEGRLVIDGMTPKPQFVSCTSGSMRVIIPGTGALDCCIICCLI